MRKRKGKILIFTLAVSFTIGLIAQWAIGGGPIVMEPSYSAGTAALPSIKIIGDEDTGIWSPAANTLAISTGGVEAVRWNNSQQTLLPDGSAAAPALAASGASNRGWFRSGNFWYYSSGGVASMEFGGDLTFRSSAAIAWRSDPNVELGTTDLTLARDAAAILAQRNSTNAQEYRIYNTDGATIDEFLSIGFINNANVATFQTEQIGGGTVRDFAFMGGNVGIGVTSFGTSAANVLGITADGTVPSTSPAGMIQLYGDDSSDGAANATLAFRLEQAAEAIGTFTESHKLKIWINGVEYWISLDAV